MFDYRDAVAVVTGASSGIGRQLAADLLTRGARVVGVARRAGDIPTGCEARSCDLHDLDAWVQLLQDVEASRGRIDVLVNAAGMEQRHGIAEVAWDEVQDTMTVNFGAAVRGMITVVPGMLARRHGAVLNISSDSGRAPGAGNPAYCASKAALSAFTESVAHEVTGSGVHLHVLYPGFVPTPMGQHAVDSGMPEPPGFVRRTAEQVSRQALDSLGSPGVDINAARIAVLAPVVRALAPPLYRRSMRGR